MRAPILPRQTAAQDETRSHGFFYRRTDETSGMLGLPVRARRDAATIASGAPGGRPLRRGAQWRSTRSANSTAQPDRNADDDCQASCTDWYGNARPLFLGDRVFALMGYELVEGRVSAGRIREVQRLSFAPTAHASGN